ncbi:receptor-type tyrosine-protein phosphatase mu-like isoform X1 [Littorina saxatilis]|uniref:receptor-type tyrosine-protein phosphatase mu-like isoform X1 n=1 Tax=Littorina saxatilis TaxID=31220 RepID=UPI0038B4562F
MKLCRTAFALVIYLFVPMQAELQCSCHNECGNNGTTFPSSNGNIVNVAYGKPANMSSVFQRDGGSGPACVAVNGRTDTMWVPRNNDNTNCVHTNEFDYAAFWLVDLGRNYTVTDITVFRRKGDPLRMSGMSVFVDNQLCYSFLNRTAANIAALNALPERINITCPTPLTGRQVRFQKHGWDRNFDPGGYILNICEVQVWACKDGLYGAQCDQTCSGHCKDNDTCDNYYGTCPTGCSTGYRGADCRCGHCRDGADCDVTTLRCLSGCDKGWDTQFCNQSCTADTHGYDCGERCGQCADGDTCNTVTGLCPNGCQPGWQGNTCKQKCADGYYGQRCMSLCGNCSNSEMCDKVTGTCPTGCQPGFDPSDPLCKTRTPEILSDQPGITTIIGAVVGVVVILAIILIIICVIVRRRRSKQKETGADSSNASRGRTQQKENESHGTTLSFEPVQEPEVKTKPAKPSAMVKPTVIKKPKMKNSEDADESAHIYYNTANTVTPPSTSPTPSTSAVQPPATASTQDSPSQQAQAPASCPAPRTRSPTSMRQVADPADYDEEISGAEGNNVYYNNEEDVYASFKATQPKLDAVQKHLVDALASGKLKEEFATLESMPEGVPQEVALLKKNFKKNRFAAVLPYDHNLVVLRDGYSEGKATDFVNASYVSGYQLDKQFIAAQGPRDNTVGDLWRMIWQEQITHVVMLTNIKERGKPKCELYWPEEEGGVDTFGPVTVTTTHVQCRDDFYIRTFNVQRAGSEESREVTQYHYVSWPDHGVPTTTSLVTFWRYVHNRTKPVDGAAVPPVLVHCSAGVGRTGSYIGLEIGVDMAVNKGHINVLDLVKRLREERCLMVQAVDQYLFLHKALLEAYTAHGTNVSVDRFDVIFTEPINSGKPHPRVDQEFQTLQQMLTLTPAHRHDTASVEENKAKNRNPDILPSEEHLVYLTEHVSGRNQYINAVFMPTFRDHRGSIVTQLPLPSTLVDFWRLVYGNDVNAIVSLSSPNEEQEVKPYCQYWPINKGKSLTFGPYSVNLTSKTERRGSKVTSYRLNLGKKGVTSTRVVELLHYKGWTGKVGGSTSDILHLIDTLVTLQENTNTDRLVVQSSDGVGKSGLFCALCDVINRMTYDREVDVYMTVRHMQSVTPKALSSATQYRYCYEVVQNRVREMSVYANASQR